jgi:hypothetical protein
VIGDILAIGLHWWGKVIWNPITRQGQIQANGTYDCRARHASAHLRGPGIA